MRQLLLISYYYPPYKFVGALRAAGFAQYLPEFEWNVKVVTATEPSGGEVGGGAGVDYLPPRAPSLLDRLLPIKDPGARWMQPLRQYFKETVSPESLDAVMITGGPFLHFEMVRWIKKRYPALPVVLDFRDPFANNPRLAARWPRDILAKMLERRWIRQADFTLVVTDQARELLSLRTGRHLVVENGYDDAVLSEVCESTTKAQVDGELVIAYTGKFYQNHDPIPFLQALRKLQEGGIRARLVHAGTSHSSLEPALRAFDSDVYCSLGQRSYWEALSVIHASDLGLVLSTGAGYPATTKIYDYIGLKKHLFLVDPPPEGGIMATARRYGGFTCVDNEADAIADALEGLYRRHALSALPLSNARVATFGRRYQTGKLARALHGLVSA